MFACPPLPLGAEEYPPLCTNLRHYVRTCTIFEAGVLGRAPPGSSNLQFLIEFAGVCASLCDFARFWHEFAQFCSITYEFEQLCTTLDAGILGARPLLLMICNFCMNLHEFQQICVILYDFGTNSHDFAPLCANL